MVSRKKKNRVWLIILSLIAVEIVVYSVLIATGAIG